MLVVRCKDFCYTISDNMSLFGIDVLFNNKPTIKKTVKIERVFATTGLQVDHVDRNTKLKDLGNFEFISFYSGYGEIKITKEDEEL